MDSHCSIVFYEIGAPDLGRQKEITLICADVFRFLEYRREFESITKLFWKRPSSVIYYGK